MGRRLVNKSTSQQVNKIVNQSTSQLVNWPDNCFCLFCQGKGMNCNIQILTDTHQTGISENHHNRHSRQPNIGKYSANPANIPEYLHQVYCQICTTMEEEDIFKESVITLVLTHH